MSRENKNSQPQVREQRPASRFGNAKPRLLRDDVVEIDKTILGLLARRYNLLTKMKAGSHLSAAEEKFLRENWQNEAAKVSRDPALTSNFFTLLQQLSFLPKKSENAEDVAGKDRRDTFNLHPAPFPVQIDMQAPAAEWPVLAWLYLGAASGLPVRVSPTLQNDAIVSFTKTLAQLGVLISRLHETVPGREYEVISVRPGEPMGRPDVVIHVGESKNLLYIFLAHFLGRPSRVKIMGESGLKLADLTGLRHVLPELGARLTHIVPKSSGLPVRVECSGMLPPAFDFKSELDAEFGQALILASPFYEAPFAINFSNHPARDVIFAKTLPVMEASGAVFTLDNYTINLEPCLLTLPVTPDLPVSPALTAFLLALCEPLRGNVTLEGAWPDWPECNSLWYAATNMNLPWSQEGKTLLAKNKIPLNEFDATAISPSSWAKLPVWGTPLLVSLAACAVLANGKAKLPPEILAISEVGDFLRACSLQANAEGELAKDPESASNPVWAAPTPEWAMALALAACTRASGQGLRLANPGVMMELWPGFWNLYNTLPKPRAKSRPTVTEPVKKRRRVLTDAVSEPPELKEEDWD